MNAETLLSQAKIEAEKRYPDSGSRIMQDIYNENDAAEKECNAFLAGVEYAITHLQAQGERWEPVSLDKDNPTEKTFIQKAAVIAPENEAVGFKDWCDAHAWEYDYREQVTHTTQQLYTIYKNQK